MPKTFERIYPSPVPGQSREAVKAHRQQIPKLTGWPLVTNSQTDQPIMKTSSWKPCALLVSLGLSATALPSVAATLVSNLAQPDGGTASVTSTATIGQGFVTGTDPAGYDLVSATLNLFLGSGSPGDIVVRVWDDDAGSPGSPIATLTGANPGAGPTATYSTTGSVVLMPNTRHFISASAPDAPASAEYTWGRTFTGAEDPAAAPGWSIGGDVSFTSTSTPDAGSIWGISSGEARLSIAANPIPEPGQLLLVFVGSALVFRRGRTAC